MLLSSLDSGRFPWIIINNKPKNVFFSSGTFRSSKAIRFSHFLGGFARPIAYIYICLLYYFTQNILIKKSPMVFHNLDLVLALP